MKNILIKTSLAFLSFVVVIMIVCNSYMFLVTYKLSESVGLFDKIEVISKYNVFENLWIGASSLFLTIILLCTLFGFIIKDFVVKSKKI